MNQFSKALGLAILAVPSLVWAENTAAAETTVPGGTLMLAAYLVLWVMIVAFLVVLSRRQSGIDADLVVLRKRMDELLGVDED